MSEERESVAATNERFYRAFERLDLDEMGRIWAHDDSIQCGHPGWSVLRGRRAVMESWRRIFENSPPVRIMLTDVSVEVRGVIAWVTLYEHLNSSLEGQQMAATVLATNIFEKRAGGWRLVHHHGSPVAQQPPQPDPGTVH
jgi:ketosteroid isomerase-like protein